MTLFAAACGLPAIWLSVLAHYRRRKLEQALRRDGCAAAAVAFPELDGIRLALLGMHNVDGGTVLYGHASGMMLAGSRRPPGRNWISRCGYGCAMAAGGGTPRARPPAAGARKTTAT